MPVAARDEVYEYIIFRGTDIKKIEVCDTPKQPTLPGGLHNDPAIVQVYFGSLKVALDYNSVTIPHVTCLV